MPADPQAGAGAGAAAVPLHTLLGDHPVTRALKRAEVMPERIRFEFADVNVPNTAFKRVVRDLEFDVAELAIMTFLMAKARGVPLVLLPAVITARFQHPYLVYNAERAHLSPGELAGRRVGIRSWSVTTAVWIRSILAGDCGVDIDRVNWVTFEDAHVAGCADPPHCERAPAGKNMKDMLLAGELDAAVLASPVLEDSRLKTVFSDPAAAAADWHRRHQAIQVNHMIVVKAALARAEPQLMRELYRLLSESRAAAGLPAPGALDANPFGIEANRRNLEVAVECAWRQRLIGERLAVDALFDDATRFA